MTVKNNSKMESKLLNKAINPIPMSIKEIKGWIEKYKILADVYRNNLNVDKHEIVSKKLNTLNFELGNKEAYYEFYIYGVHVIHEWLDT